MRPLICVCSALRYLLTGALLLAQAQTIVQAQVDDVLTPKEWEEVTSSVDDALNWLASQQQPNGSFPTLQIGEPGVTGLCVMAFLAQGHLPGEGEHGEVLQAAIDYIVSCQKKNGLLASVAPNGITLSRNVKHELGVTVSYNHAIAGLVLSESYAMSGSASSRAIQPVIEKALEVTFKMQDWPKERADDAGGWRYLDDRDQFDSDLSITGWQLMFLRSAKNAGFEIEEARIGRAVGYVRRCFLLDEGTFTYKAEPNGRTSRGMAGAGILALAHSGMHHTAEAQRTGDWILRAGFERFNSSGRLSGNNRHGDRYFYGLLTCSQAMYQLGDQHWRDFFPPVAEVLLRNQNSDGSWDRESHQGDQKWGKAYTTAIAVMALSAPNQLLPVFQR